MKNSNWGSTKITALLNIDYPIIQGPFGGGLSSVELTSTVSNLGGLGSFGCQPYTADEIISFCSAIRKETNKPFNLNLWVNDRDERLATYDATHYEALKTIFKPYFDELGISLPAMPSYLGPTYNDQVQAILETKPPVFSFVYGIPSAAVLEECSSNGSIIIGTATTVEEAIAIEKAGADAVVATGAEAGGHRVSFMSAPEHSLTGTFALVPQVADAVSIPVIAAGGIADARGIKAALTLGAAAVQIGTAFLATKESKAKEEHKAKLFSEEAKYTTLTKIFTGRLARGIRSRLTEELKDKEHLMAPYPMQAFFLRSLQLAVSKKSIPAYTTFWCGQSAALLEHHDADSLFNALVNETNGLYS